LFVLFQKSDTQHVRRAQRGFGRGQLGGGQFSQGNIGGGQFGFQEPVEDQSTLFELIETSGSTFRSPFRSQTILGAAVVRAGLDGVLNGDGNFGVFAPNNFAFNSLPADLANTLFNNDNFIPHLQDLLLYHVLGTVTDQNFDGDSLATLNGESVAVSLVRRLNRPIPPSTIFRSVNGNSVVGRNNIVASNGVATVINGVLLPSWVSNSITDRVLADSDLSTLFTVLEIASLDGALRGAGNLTLVAPINSAFAALGNETIAFLISAEGLATLTDILLYHVFPDVIVSSELSNGLTTTTLLANKIVTVSVNFNGVFFNDSKAVQVDILANNGVVHKINKVLTIPKSKK
jgi:uncharacterized surface protein with fasciclin (FAS1) repeats